MLTRTSRRRRLAALLMLPFLLLLAGCGKLEATFDVQDVDTINVAMDIAVKSDLAQDYYSSSDEFCAGAESEDSGGFGQATWEPYEDGDMWGCTIEGVLTRDDFGSDFTLEESDGELHFTMNQGSEGITQEDLAAFPEADQFQVDVTFTFPGKVTNSAGGTVDGNSVHYTDLVELSQGVDITAKAGGFPWLVVIIIAVVLGFLALLVVAAIIFFVVRSRRKKAAAGTGTPGAPAAFGAGAGAAAYPGSPAASGSPAPPAAPAQGQQPWGSPAPGSPAPDQQAPGQQVPGQQAPQAPQGQQPWGSPAPEQQAPQQGGWQQPPASPAPPAPQPPQQNGWQQPPAPGEQGGQGQNGQGQQPWGS